MRRSHHALETTNIVVDSKTGEPKLPHHISLTDGYYKGKRVVIPKTLRKSKKES